MKCCIIGCNSNDTAFLNTKERISFHRLFSRGSIKEDWVKAVRTHHGQEFGTATPPKSMICSAHFEKRCLRNLVGQIRLTPGAVPTIFPKMIKKEDDDVKPIVSSYPNDTVVNPLTSNSPNYDAEHEKVKAFSITFVTTDKEHEDVKPFLSNEQSSNSSSVPNRTPDPQTEVQNSPITQLKRKRIDQQYTRDTDTDLMKLYADDLQDLLNEKNTTLSHLKQQHDRKIQKLRSLINDMEQSNIISQNAAELIRLELSK